MLSARAAPASPGTKVPSGRCVLPSERLGPAEWESSSSSTPTVFGSAVWPVLQNTKRPSASRPCAPRSWPLLRVVLGALEQASRQPVFRPPVARGSVRWFHATAELTASQRMPGEGRTLRSECRVQRVGEHTTAAVGHAWGFTQPAQQTAPIHMELWPTPLCYEHRRTSDQ